MNFWPGLLALILCCFLYSSLTTCQPLESISEDDLNRQLQELPPKMYEDYLFYVIPAASLGKNLFKIPRSVSENCTRTAKLFMQAFFELSYSEFMVVPIIGRSINETVKNMTGSTFHDQVEMLCQNLDKGAEASQLPFFADFEDSKKMGEVPKPAKDYIAEIPAGQRLIEWAHTTPMPHDEPQIFKFQIFMKMRQFRNLQYPSENQRESAVIAKAIYEVARKRHTGYPERLNKVFMETLNDFVKNPPTKPRDQSDIQAFYAAEFLEKVDVELLHLCDNPLKDFYKDFRKTASDQLIPKSTN